MTDPYLDGIMRRMKRRGEEIAKREEMTDTKPQVITNRQEAFEFAHMKASVSNLARAYIEVYNELQSIRSAELPVEPESVKRMRRYESGGYVQGNVKTGDVLNHIDALKAYALKEKEESVEARAQHSDAVMRLADVESELARLSIESLNRSE